MAWIFGVALVLGLVVLAWLAVNFRPVTIYDGYQGVLYKDGRFERVLPPGRYRVFRPGDRARVDTVRTRQEVITGGSIDVVSADGFLFRLTPSLLAAAKDAREVAMDPSRSKLHLLLAEATVATVGRVELKALIESRSAVAEQIAATLSPRLPEYEVSGAVLTAFVLPPEVRRLTSEVERARLEGLAALERARGEQAALRALSNAARMLKDNPDLARLRALQAFEASKGATLVLGADKYGV